MMNLATRCTACGTIFRVVQDQLKVSEGWVRCGRCQAVFNAQQGLFDLDREAPPPWNPVTAPPEASGTPESTAAAESISAPGDEVDPLAPAAVAVAYDAEVKPNPDSMPSYPASSWDTGTALDVENPADNIDAADAVATVEDTHAANDNDSSSLPTDALQTAASVDPDNAEAARTEADSVPPTPEFVRQAERDERWEQTPVRAALAFLMAIAVLGLALQVTGHFRQRIAAHWPESTPWLQRYCDVFGCRLDALRRIDDVSIESTALTQGPGPADPEATSDAAANALRLVVTLRNRGEVPIAMPSVDLSLTGPDGELVSRRALSPADFQVGDPQLSPGADAPLSVRFSVTGRRVSGYTVEVFYP